ncbi:MAG TPA: hypothetical protein VFB93_12750 [Burkholderiales bacterium]|nr:hypothetical protein [Burkholderiales bacterium]
MNGVVPGMVTVTLPVQPAPVVVGHIIRLVRVPVWAEQVPTSKRLQVTLVSHCAFTGGLTPSSKVQATVCPGAVADVMSKPTPVMDGDVICALSSKNLMAESIVLPP